MPCRAIVMNTDRDWALAQKPEWARMHDEETDNEIVDDGGWLDEERRHDLPGPSWFSFVIGEIESFESYFGDDRKTHAEWSAIWRKAWWPKRKEEWAWKHMAKKQTQPFFRKGTQEFAIALRLGSEDEKRMWIRFGVAQFKPDDPRVQKIKAGAKRKDAAE